MDKIKPALQLSDRELQEIQHAMYYRNYLNHGTAGHNQLLLIAKLAAHLGIGLSADRTGLVNADEFRATDAW